MKNGKCDIKMEDVNKIIKKPKKTLWDKRLSDDENPRIYFNDVKESLKELIIFIENDNNVEKIKIKVKEIFGKEVIQ